MMSLNTNKSISMIMVLMVAVAAMVAVVDVEAGSGSVRGLVNGVDDGRDLITSYSDPHQGAPPQDRALQTPECTETDQIELIRTVGSTSFPKEPDNGIEIVSVETSTTTTEPNTVTVNLKQLWTASTIDSVFAYYQTSTFDKKCFETKDVAQGLFDTITITCNYLTPVAYLEICVDDSFKNEVLVTKDDAKIPDCCYPEKEPETGTVCYVFEIGCVPKCDTEPPTLPPFAETKTETPVETRAPVDPTTASPTKATTSPTTAPTKATTAPTKETLAPTKETAAPTKTTSSPTNAPTKETAAPTKATSAPTKETAAPTKATPSPTNAPTKETSAPTKTTSTPTKATAAPSKATPSPTNAPTKATTAPTKATSFPTIAPTKETDAPTKATPSPTASPTAAPVEPTAVPTDLQEPVDPGTFCHALKVRSGCNLTGPGSCAVQPGPRSDKYPDGTPSCGVGVPVGYYPDLSNCNAYCWCSGTAAPSRYEIVNTGLEWDNMAGSASYLSGKWGKNGAWGTNGGNPGRDTDMSKEGRKRPPQCGPKQTCPSGSYKSQPWNGCKQWYTCVNGNAGAVRDCGDQQLFDKKLQICNWESAVNCNI